MAFLCNLTTCLRRVCLAFKPSFEMRFLTVRPGGAPSYRWVISRMLTAPCRSTKRDTRQIETFFRRAQAQALLQPDLVDFLMDANVRATPWAANC